MNIRTVLAAVGLLSLAAWVAGCETIARAKTAQDAVASAAVPLSETNGLPKERIDLQAFRLIDFVEYAMTNRPSIHSAQLAVSNAVLTLKTVSSERSVQINGTGGYSQSTANGSHFSWHQNKGRGTAGISFDLLICDFGRIDARERAAREGLVAAQCQLADEEFVVFNEVCSAYFTLLRNDALLEVARTNEFQYAEHLKQSESLFDAGEVKKLDVLKARVDLSGARLDTISASNDVLTAGAEFLRALGVPAGRAQRADVLAVAEDCLNAAKSELPVTAYTPIEALGLARINAPSLMILRAKLRAASAEVDYTVADLMPELSLTSAFSFADPAWNWSWGLNVLQSLFQGYRKTTAVDAAVVAMKTARTDVDAAEQKLSHDLAVAVAVRDNARQSFETARIEVEQARENLENVIQQYKVGDASRIDFTDAATGLADALGARVKAFYAGQIAEAELVKLTGSEPDRSHSRAKKNQAQPTLKGTEK